MTIENKLIISGYFFSRCRLFSWFRFHSCENTCFRASKGSNWHTQWTTSRWFVNSKNHRESRSLMITAQGRASAALFLRITSPVLLTQATLYTFTGCYSHADCCELLHPMIMPLVEYVWQDCYMNYSKIHKRTSLHNDALTILAR